MATMVAIFLGGLTRRFRSFQRCQSNENKIRNCSGVLTVLVDQQREAATRPPRRVERECVEGRLLEDFAA